MRKSICFYLNGQRVEVSDEKAGLMLSDFLRLEKALTGTKVVCSEGDCGACTVLRHDRGRFLPINSCIVTVAQLDGSSVVSVDALATKSSLTEVQARMVDCHGSQCGFCTPGIVMALTGVVEKKLKQKEKCLSRRDALNALTGNLCRCTGYEQILDAAEAVDFKKCETLTKRFITPEISRELKKISASGVHLKAPGFEFFAPRSFGEACKFLKSRPQTRILAAATDLGVFHNKRRARLTSVLSLHLIPNLDEINLLRGGQVEVGARVSLAELREFAKTHEPELSRMLDIFASPQIKNAATLIGNVANASPIADTPPFLLVAKAEIAIVGPRGKRTVAIDDFFLGYRKTALKPGELISHIRFSKTGANGKLRLFKISERKDLDISTVNAGFFIKTSKAATISEARIAYGGVAATPLRLRKTENYLIGKEPTLDVIQNAIAIMQGEITPLSDVRGGTVYRRVLAENLMRRFFREAEAVE